jgi:hypothetical protein
VTAGVVQVANVAEQLLAGTDRIPKVRADLFLAAEGVRFAARHECQRESEGQWEYVHRDSFQLWP